jgi:hypothetical protein
MVENDPAMPPESDKPQVENRHLIRALVRGAGNLLKGKKRKAIAAGSAAVIAVGLAPGVRNNTISGSPHKEAPKAQADRAKVEFGSQNKIEHIEFVAKDAICRTQELVWLLHEKYITPEYWDGVVVLKGGTKLSLTPNNQTLELSDSVENDGDNDETGFIEVPSEEAWVAKDPKIFGTLHGPDYLYFEVDGKVCWLEINSPEATNGAEWYLANGQLGQANEVQFREGKRIDPPTNPKEGQSFKRINREDWQRYLATIGVEKDQPPTSQPSGY